MGTDTKEEEEVPMEPSVDAPAESASAAAPAKTKRELKEEEKDKTTIFVRNLTFDCTAQDLQDLFSEVGPIKHSFVITDKGTEKCRGFGYVMFAVEEDAKTALETYEGRDFKGRKLRLTIAKKKQHLRDGKGEKKTKGKDKKNGVLLATLVPSAKDGRLIVRNLPFSCTEQDLQKAFGAFGTVKEVRLPLKPDGKTPRGFGFVQMSTKEEGEKAIAGINEKKIKGRVVAVDWSLSKNLYQAAQEAAVETEAAEPLPAVEEMETDETETQDKEKKKKTKSVKKQTQDDEEEENDEEEAEEEEAAAEEEAEEEEEEEEEDGEAKKKESKSESGSKAYDPNKASKDVSQGVSVFLRNLSFDTTEDKIKEYFTKFGPIRYVKMVMDPATGRPRGTAFVCFKEREGADRAVQESNKAEAAFMDNYRKTKNSTKLSTAALFTDAESTMNMDGRRIFASHALSRTEASKTAEEKKTGREVGAPKKDKRNLYLAKEGLILAEDEAAKDVSKSDIERRQKAWQEKKEKLRNPNYFINPCRLSIRNLPTEVDDVRLRRMIMNILDKKTKAVEKVTIVRTPDRLDTKTGQPRSKGYGFVSLIDHDDAVKVLRHMNNNPSYFGKDRRPIVEFAVEDARAVRIQQLKQDKIEQSRQKDNQKASGKAAPVQSEDKKSKKRKQSEDDNTTPKKEDKKDKKDNKDKKDKKDKKEKKDNKDQPTKLSRGQRQRLKKRLAQENAAEEEDQTVNQPKKKRKTSADEVTVSQPKKQQKQKSDDVSKLNEMLDELDRLAAGAFEDDAEKKTNKKRKRANQTDRKEEKTFEKQVQEHKKKFFGSQDATKNLEKRWFD